jgi:antitoxin PrlF
METSGRLVLRISATLRAGLAALADWEHRSLNKQIEFLLDRCVREEMVRAAENPTRQKGERSGQLDLGAAAWYYISTNVMEAQMESAITVKGQATIPKAIREHLRLKPGDRVKFFVHPDGSVVLLPKLSASALRGMIKSRRKRPVTTAQMTEAVAEGAAGVPRRAAHR